ncbi:MAG: urease accessory protein UreF [Sulfitobacter sp.]
MAMGAPMPMRMGIPIMQIDARLLTAAQWLSPAFPLGGFAYSHGLEQAVAAGWVHDAQGLEEWLRDLARLGSGQNDAIWIALGFGCEGAEEAQALNAQCRAFCPAPERRREAQRQGEAFARITAEVWDIELPGLQFPVALGRAARLAGLPLQPVIALYLQGFFGNLVAAAQRLLPIGQSRAQAVLASLTHDCLAMAAQAEGAGIEDIGSATFLSDIAAMGHETLQPRIFQS